MNPRECGAGRTRSACDLTARQRLALQLVSQGLATKEIAVLMLISEAGAKKHILGLMRRYRALNRAQLVRRAIEHGDLPIVEVLHDTELRSVQWDDENSSRANHSQGEDLVNTNAQLQIEVQVPTEYLAAVVDDLRTRGAAPQLRSDGPSSVVVGTMASSEIATYAERLRSLTAGRGTFRAEPTQAK